MQARSALFDLYGDHLRQRGGQAPVSALIRLLAPLGVAAPAVRTAVSRTVRQGWLVPVRTESGPGYRLTPRAARRLDESAARIYRTDATAWRGHFDLLVVDLPESRTERDRIVANLTFLGYGRLNAAVWIAPRPSAEVAALLVESGVRAERLDATHRLGSAGAAVMVSRAWNLPAIAAAYQGFLAHWEPLMLEAGRATEDEVSYAARFRLVHAWRTFLFRDPQLPTSLLPAHWPGTAAAAFFDRHAGRLRPAADRFVDRCLDS
jgi:phenylacetic acid degradation operon negative regulatory protein